MELSDWRFIFIFILFIRRIPYPITAGSARGNGIRYTFNNVSHYRGVGTQQMPRKEIRVKDKEAMEFIRHERAAERDAQTQREYKIKKLDLDMHSWNWESFRHRNEWDRGQETRGTGKDDVDSYLYWFERFAATNCFIDGTYPETYSRSSIEEACGYGVVKNALLARYDVI